MSQHSVENQSILHKYPDGKQLIFSSTEDGRDRILQDSMAPFFSLLTELDMSIRMNKPRRDQSMEEFTELFTGFVRESVIDWNPEEVKWVARVFDDAKEYIDALEPGLFHHEVYLIKTTGIEEGGAYYTRNNAIVIPEVKLQQRHNPEFRERFLKVMIHELFHIYSRYNPGKRNELYAAIGFTPVVLENAGEWLENRRLTNPDGGDFGYKITVARENGENTDAAMIVYSKYDNYDPGITKFFEYVTFGLFEVESENGGYKVKNPENPQPLDLEKISGFYEQTGRNTGYILHPDEILADNITMLVLYKTTGKLPGHVDGHGKKLLEKLEGVLTG